MLQSPRNKTTTSEQADAPPARASTPEQQVFPPTPDQISAAIARIETTIPSCEQMLRDLEEFSRKQFQALEETINREFAEMEPLTYAYNGSDFAPTTSAASALPSNEHTPLPSLQTPYKP